MREQRATTATLLAAALLLAGCWGGTEPDARSGPAAVETERGPVPLDRYHARLTSPTELAVDVPSCDGDPTLDALEEGEGQVRIRIVTTVVVRGDSAACNDTVTVVLAQPLDGRNLIDLVSERPIDVRLDLADSINLRDVPAGTTRAAFVDGHPVFG